MTEILQVPEGTYSCVKGTEKTRIDTAAVVEDTKVRMMEVGYWGSSALSDRHTPMMLIAAWPEVIVWRPKAKVRMCAHEQKNVEPSREELISYRSSLARRKQPDWREWPPEWLNQLQKAMHDWAEMNGHLEWKKVKPGPPLEAERWKEGQQYYRKGGGVEGMLPDVEHLEREMMAITGIPGQNIGQAKKALAKMERKALKQSEVYRVARAKKKREYQMELHREAELWTGVKEATRH